MCSGNGSSSSVSKHSFKKTQTKPNKQTNNDQTNKYTHTHISTCFKEGLWVQVGNLKGCVRGCVVRVLDLQLRRQSYPSHVLSSSHIKRKQLSWTAYHRYRKSLSLKICHMQSILHHMQMKTACVDKLKSTTRSSWNFGWSKKYCKIWSALPSLSDRGVNELCLETKSR